MLNTNVDYSKTDVEKNLIVLLHEIMHILALSSVHFDHVIDANLNPIPKSKVLVETTRRGKTVS